MRAHMSTGVRYCDTHSILPPFTYTQTTGKGRHMVMISSTTYKSIYSVSEYYAILSQTAIIKR